MFFVMILAVIFLWTKETMIMKLASVAYGLMHDYILLLKILSCVYLSPREISSLKEIFHRIPLAPGL